MQSEKGDLFSNFVLKIFTLHVYKGFISLYAVLLCHELECVKCRLCRRARVCLPFGLCLPSFLFHECEKVNAVADLKVGCKGCLLCPVVYFHAVLAKIMPDNRLTPLLGLTLHCRIWIRNCNVTEASRSCS